jgi:hypothetical protein
MFAPANVCYRDVLVLYNRRRWTHARYLLHDSRPGSGRRLLRIERTPPSTTGRDPRAPSVGPPVLLLGQGATAGQ